MFKGLKTMLLTGLGSALMFVAGTGIGINSIWMLYEPDTPKSLKK
ncbi:cyclic lactone autoinducer peptide [Desulfofalx alkaliphila]|nr:cyclic lactone autoinducer peptide [Desulfofalx alkaliphila]